MHGFPGSHKVIMGLAKGTVIDTTMDAAVIRESVSSAFSRCFTTGFTLHALPLLVCRIVYTPTLLWPLIPVIPFHQGELVPLSGRSLPLSSYPLYIVKDRGFESSLKGLGYESGVRVEFPWVKESTIVLRAGSAPVINALELVARGKLVLGKQPLRSFTVIRAEGLTVRITVVVLPTRVDGIIMSSEALLIPLNRSAQIALLVSARELDDISWLSSSEIGVVAEARVGSTIAPETACRVEVAGDHVLIENCDPLSAAQLIEKLGGAGVAEARTRLPPYAWALS